MKRMKKKVVAMVTLAMFMMTLLPMAAFAAAGDADNQTSVYQVVEAGQSVDTDTAVKTEFLLNDEGGYPVAPGKTLDNVYVWATAKGSDVPSSAAQFSANEDMSNVISKTNDISKLTSAVKNGEELYVQFTRPGTYVIHAGVDATVDSSANYDLDKITEFASNDAERNTIEVTRADVAVKTVVVPASKKTELQKVITINNDGNKGVSTDLVNGAEITVANYTGADTGFLANGIDEDSITFTVKDENGKIVRNADFAVSVNKAGLKATAVGNEQGEMKLSYSMTKEDAYKIYLTKDDVKITVNVSKDTPDSEIAGIENTTEDAKTLLACGDKTYGAQNGVTKFEDAVQFTITDNKGNVVEGDSAITGQNCAAATKDTKYIVVEEKPDKSTLKAEDLQVVWSDEKEAYTLQLATSAQTSKAKKLIAGDYSVEVKLNNGHSAVANFKLADFGEVKGLSVEVKEAGTKVVTDEIKAGTTNNTVTVNRVDENGIELKYDAASVNIEGKAVKAGAKAAGFNLEKGEDYYGSEVTIQAFDSEYGIFKDVKLTVVENYGTNILTFDSEEGKVNANNKVKVQVVNAKGNAVKVGNEMYAYVLDQSNKDANVEVTPNNAAGTVTDGKANLTIFSDKETKLEIQVVVVDKAVSDNPKFYAKTLTYQVGPNTDENADTTVVMTLGSTNMIVNNNIVDMKDAAPFAQDNRTFVPFRALATALGADVEYVQADNTVSYKLGGTEIVMTLGEKTYTVNGAEKTMDVAPFAKDNRTYVPVRFVGEALGFKVTGLQDGNGQYVAVAFTK